MSLKSQIAAVILLCVSIPLILEIDFIFDFSGSLINDDASLMARILLIMNFALPYVVLIGHRLRIGMKNEYPFANTLSGILTACVVWSIALAIEPSFVNTVYNFVPRLNLYSPMSELATIGFIYSYSAFFLGLAVGLSHVAFKVSMDKGALNKKIIR